MFLTAMVAQGSNVQTSVSTTGLSG